MRVESTSDSVQLTEIGCNHASYGMNSVQKIVLILLVTFLLFNIVDATARLTLFWIVHLVAISVSITKFAACLSPPHRNDTSLDVRQLTIAPTYTIILALYDEAAMVPSLLDRIAALQYPAERMQIIVALEEDDLATQCACQSALRRGEIEIVTPSPGPPRTKPRALNAALARARGEYVVVYDAEDAPHPAQLTEAAARFAAADRRLAVLQAPLRIATRPGAREIERQFALDYAAQFEVMLPFLLRCGLPIPLGGTSNHFRRSALLAVSGWDAWNVTEDADIGLRLHRAGYRTALLTCPTVEQAPPSIAIWRRQRGRWIKGFIQTLMVHSRSLHPLDIPLLIAMSLTLVAAIGSAFVQAPAMAFTLACLLEWSVLGDHSQINWSGSCLTMLEMSGSLLAMGIGARRAGLTPRWRSLIAAPLYWPLQSAALWRALHQLATSPYQWDKTAHTPPDPDQMERPCALDARAAFGLSRKGENSPSTDCAGRNHAPHPSLGRLRAPG